MRNKAKFNEDYVAMVKDHICEEVDCVQMAAHDMRHTGKTIIEVSGEFTRSGRPVKFNFTKEEREGTDTVVDGETGDEIVMDYVYQGMDGE